MTDIVEMEERNAPWTAQCAKGHIFLSGPKCPWCEIERLRALDSVSLVLKQMKEIERLRAECERLESLNDIDLAARDEEILRLRAELAQYRYALEIIAGRRQPVDNTLGNVEVARYALDAARKGEA